MAGIFIFHSGGIRAELDIFRWMFSYDLFIKSIVSLHVVSFFGSLFFVLH
jgi:hypothetical protein